MGNDKLKLQEDFVLHNTRTRTKEHFRPKHAPHVGMYVCGPTVYGDAHLGHARPAVTFDLLFRYLTHLGYKVRYVRNITDVGHLEHDSDDGEDKIAKKARLDQVEPMEVVQHYLTRYHRDMDAMNVLPPSIEPMASGHIIEQIQLIEEILKAGFAYESEGSIYFDVPKYNQAHDYGVLSGRDINEMLAQTRELDGQDEKRSPVDFALWKKAKPEHIMRWPSPWSVGFPGWHCECTAMGRKYLGEDFDLHGGGMDLIFPHHECEIAQAVAAEGKEIVNFWVHNNMVTINGQKMGKSLGNFITLEQFFSGEHPALAQAYHPMTIRFFMLQAHYRSTIDFSNEALQASEKGLERLLDAYDQLDKLTPTQSVVQELPDYFGRSYAALNDDLNSAVVIAELFDATKRINSAKNEPNAGLTQEQIDLLRSFFDTFLFEILGMLPHGANGSKGHEEAFAGAMELLLKIRHEAKEMKDWAKSDQIRDELTKLGFVIKDTKEGAEWKLN